MDTLTSLLPMFILLGIVVFASDRQEKRKVELEKVKAKAEWDRASESFRDDVTQEELEEIVASTRRSVKRLESLTVVGHRVYGAVATLSGISSWKFVIDFDYEGHLTSDYTVASSNEDSGIPERVAVLIAKGIRTWTPGGPKCARLSAPIAAPRHPATRRTALLVEPSCRRCRRGRSWDQNGCGHEQKNVNLNTEPGCQI